MYARAPGNPQADLYAQQTSKFSIYPSQRQAKSAGAEGASRSKLVMPPSCTSAKPGNIAFQTGFLPLAMTKRGIVTLVRAHADVTSKRLASAARPQLQICSKSNVLLNAMHMLDSPSPCLLRRALDTLAAVRVSLVVILIHSHAVRAVEGPRARRAVQVF
jgi:hypothetical protein